MGQERRPINRSEARERATGEVRRQWGRRGGQWTGHGAGEKANGQVKRPGSRRGGHCTGQVEEARGKRGADGQVRRPGGQERGAMDR